MAGCTADDREVRVADCTISYEEEKEGELSIEHSCKPEILLSGNKRLEEHTRAGIEALIKQNYPETIFQMCGKLVEIIQDSEGIYKINRIKQNTLKLKLADSARWYTEKVTSEGTSEYDVYPNDSIVGAIYDTPEEWRGIPFLKGLINTPIPRKDGSIVTMHGYDRRSGYYFTPGLDIPPIDDEDLSQEWAKQAAKYLTENLFDDFPLKDNASKANMLAALITPTLRPFTGRPPLFVITKPSPGEGSSLLVDIVCVVNTGNTASVQDANVKEETEIRKLLMSVLMAGKTILPWDNLDQNNKFKSPAYASLLTADIVSGRVLGHNDVPDLPNNLCGYLTGRNVKLGGDIPRRSVLIEMDAIDMDLLLNPEARNFKHPNIITWVLENRNALVYMILIMFRAWVIAGKPKAKTPILSKFETWSEVLGGVLEYAGVEGFLGNKKIVENEMNTETDEWYAFANALHENLKGYNSARTIFNKISENSAIKDTLPEELEKIMIDNDGKLIENIKGLGRKLQTMKNVPLRDGLTIRVKKDEHTKMNTFYVEKSKNS